MSKDIKETVVHSELSEPGAEKRFTVRKGSLTLVKRTGIRAGALPPLQLPQNPLGGEH